LSLPFVIVVVGSRSQHGLTPGAFVIKKDPRSLFLNCKKKKEKEK